MNKHLLTIEEIEISAAESDADLQVRLAIGRACDCAEIHHALIHHYPYCVSPSESYEY